jgi:hypothetical protein
VGSSVLGDSFLKMGSHAKGRTLIECVWEQRLFVTKRAELGGSWRRLHSEKLSLSFTIYDGDQAKDVEMGRTCDTHGRDEMCIKYFGRNI